MSLRNARHSERGRFSGFFAIDSFGDGFFTLTWTIERRNALGLW